MMKYPCSGVILAGGENKRFSGINKAFSRINGEPVIDVYARLMKRLVHQTRRNQQRGLTTFKTNDELQEYLDRSMLKMGLNMLLQSFLNKYRSGERQVLLP